MTTKTIELYLYGTTTYNFNNSDELTKVKSHIAKCQSQIVKYNKTLKSLFPKIGEADFKNDTAKKEQLNREASELGLKLEAVRENVKDLSSLEIEIKKYQAGLAERQAKEVEELKSKSKKETIRTQLLAKQEDLVNAIYNKQKKDKTYSVAAFIRELKTMLEQG
ncbi:hypothetical protein AS889_18165 [Pseudomonas putida]|uniref:hypothetical protein n=1 Tax=Pseudomonas putida TaxID=303 RepID=UPI00077170E0|nr:hypothetical protein [Pseudomonas putida]KWW13578.1 hypothetical protein AS889_18165 [Pseudomonas putida]